jgi:hypothetical protein
MKPLGPLLEQAMRERSCRAEIQAAEEAPKLDFVKRIREDVLRGGLLRPGQVRRWITKQVSKQAGYSTFQRAQEFSGGTIENCAPRILTTGGKTQPLRLKVDVFERDGVDVKRIPIPEQSISLDGPLAKVKAAANVLNQYFDWTEASSAGWLLCGSRPSARAFTISRQTGEAVGRKYRWVRLSIDYPVDIPISAIAEELEREKDTTAVFTRGTKLGLRQLEVTGFAVHRNDGRSWADVVEEWNESVPKGFRYSGVSARSQVRRDAHDTYRRVMKRELVWGKGTAK